MENVEKRVLYIKRLLSEKKAEDIENFKMKDYFVKEVIVSTSLGDKHTYALYDYLKEKLKPAGEEFFKVQSSEDWIVIDLGDILIHIMTQKYREKYNIEEFLTSLLSRKENAKSAF